MWEAIKEALIVPIIAVTTGKYMGYEVSKNPLEWILLFFYGLILIPFTLFIYPVLMVLIWIGFGLEGIFGYNVKTSTEGIEIFSKVKGNVHFYKWSEIESVDCQFEPPIFFPVLHLVEGENVKLKCVDSNELFTECKKHGIPVDEALEIHS